ncbi:MAG: hypothetical protein BBJ57_11130 [Desulfobacterales bacterium PC51MH44]|nr:MAG: hypothetical protein BBJ57_11130 [Desulfobacterales bacterium PC51MH44]
MENNNNEIGIRKVRVRISEIIYSMSEAEKRNLLKGLEKWQQSTLSDNKIGTKEVHARISEIIYSLTETEYRKLLKVLEKWQQSKPVDKRKHFRKLTSIYAICETTHCYFRDFIKNISTGGLFIETGIPLSINQELFITFSPSDSGDPIKIAGEIVRRDPKGIGVKLYDTIPGI